MVAIPDYGWWETVRRVHPDLLGNFPEIAQGLLSPEGIHWSELPGMRGVGATAFSLALLATVLHAFAPRRGARRPARALELAGDVRPGRDAANAGLPRLHVRGASRPRSPPTSGSTSDRAKRCATASGTSTPSRPRWP